MRIVLTRRESLDSADGVSIFIVALAQALIELGHQVRIVLGCLRSEAEYRRRLAPRLDLPIVPLSREPLRGFASVRAWLRGKRLIDSFRPDLVIHSEAVPLPLRGVIVQAVHDLQPRGGALAPLWRSIRRFSTRRCDHIVATTTELRDALVRDLGLPASRFALIPKCVDLQGYHNRSLASRERAILHTGMEPYKDPEATIKAFSALDDPSVKLYMEGAAQPAVQRAVAGLPDRLRDAVEVLGAADGSTLRELHGRVRVASFPTHYAVPVASATVMEAVASGTPIVASPCLSRDVMVTNGNGLVVDTEAHSMASAFRRILDDDPLWSQLSAGATGMARRFDAFRVARAYLNLAGAPDDETSPEEGRPVHGPDREHRAQKPRLLLGALSWSWVIAVPAC